MADLIDQIREIRARNNDRWVDLVRLALEARPDEAKAILRDIKANDAAISCLVEELSE